MSLHYNRFSVFLILNFHHLILATGSVLVAFAYTWFLPFYRFRFNELRCAFSWVQAGCGVGSVVTQILSDRKVTLVFFWCYSVLRTAHVRVCMCECMGVRVRVCILMCMCV
jgi:hypothetical protein